MQKTKIDWADMTWNPVTGCLHGCEYCYARKIANRFAPKMPDGKPAEYGTTHSIGNTNIPFPHGFDPTFYRNRLDEPAKIKKPQTIFVCSMADLFGKWVPDEWIESVFTACKAAPQHRYLFLTKNPNRYGKIYTSSLTNNFYIGASATDQAQINMLGFIYGNMDAISRVFVSIEPILEPINIKHPDYFAWVIVGAETGNRKGKVIPEKQWIDDIVRECRERNVPIFMKESLRLLMGADFIQEFPWSTT